MFLLDGPFELVTDRNTIKNSDTNTLADSDFKNHVKKAFDSIFLGGEDRRDDIDHNAVFRSLLERLRVDISEGTLEKEINKIDKVKEHLSRRGRLTVRSGPLNTLSFVYPSDGEENWVGVLYTLFSHFASREPKLNGSRLKDLWIRPVNMAGVSIDALALPLDVQGLPKNKLMGLEYKLKFSHEDSFNHPLYAVHNIVCWDFTKVPEPGAEVEDSYGCVGVVSFSKDYEPHIAYNLTRIQQKDEGVEKVGAVVRVVCLKELIRETFDCVMD